MYDVVLCKSGAALVNDDKDVDVSDQRLELAVLSEHCRRICSNNSELGRQAETLNNRLSVYTTTSLPVFLSGGSLV